MAWVFADDTNNTSATDDAAKFAQRFHRRTDSHITMVTGEVPPIRAEGSESYHSDTAPQLTILSFSQS